MSQRLDRRDFLRQSAGAAGSLAVAGYFTSRAAAESKSPNEKLNVACVGVGGRGAGNVSGVAGQNMVALCDVDSRTLNNAAKSFPQAKLFADYRKMLDLKEIEAVVCSTPDHQHVFVTMAALKSGRHAYCEKPLTHSVAEARLVIETAKAMKLATQMGTQVHAEKNYRRVVEIIQSGAIGPVTEVHVWVGKAWGGGERPKETPPVPEYLNWDLWLGGAPERPYNPVYHPFHWRRFWDFGQGTLGDMACHFMDLPFWALGLRHPTTIAAKGEGNGPETCPTGMTVEYEFPASTTQPAVKLIWRDGTHIPKQINEIGVPGNGVMFIGSKGQMFADYGSYRLYPEKDFKGYQPPAPTIPDSIGHHAEWIQACKTGSPTTCNFDYSGTLTEAVLLGNVAFRAGEKLEWDAANLKVKNTAAAEQYLNREYRKGWEL